MSTINQYFNDKEIAQREHYYIQLLNTYFDSLSLDYYESRVFLQNKFAGLGISKEKFNKFMFISVGIGIELVAIENKNNGQLPEHLQTIINEIILETM